jgi:hypothetical protein
MRAPREARFTNSLKSASRTRSAVVALDRRPNRRRIVVGQARDELPLPQVTPFDLAGEPFVRR